MTRTDVMEAFDEASCFDKRCTITGVDVASGTMSLWIEFDGNFANAFHYVSTNYDDGSQGLERFDALASALTSKYGAHDAHSRATRRTNTKSKLDALEGGEAFVLEWRGPHTIRLLLEKTTQGSYRVVVSYSR